MCVCLIIQWGYTTSLSLLINLSVILFTSHGIILPLKSLKRLSTILYLQPAVMHLRPLSGITPETQRYCAFFHV